MHGMLVLTVHCSGHTMIHSAAQPIAESGSRRGAVVAIQEVIVDVPRLLFRL